MSKKQSKQPGSSVKVRDIGDDLASSSAAPEEHKHTTLYGHLLHWARIGREYIVKNIPALISSALLLILGFKQIPKTIPLFDFINQHRVASPIFGIIFLLAFVVGLVISYFPEPDDTNDSRPCNSKQIHPWILATALSTTSFILSTSLLLLVLIRPIWCPATICLMPGPTIYGPHDANLEVNFIAMQSAAFALTRSPATYRLDNHSLPDSYDYRSIGTMRIDSKATPSPYILALNVHNLRSEGYSMLIEQVALAVKEIPAIPEPLNVWSLPSSQTYEGGNRYIASYWGQLPTTIVPAVYANMPSGRVQLRPIETDTIQLEVAPQITIATDLRFAIQITYRYANEASRHIFTLPYTFEVIFGKGANWHPYHLQNGRLVPGS